MKIYLLDINKQMTDAWEQEFGGKKVENIEIINDDFAHFMNTHPKIDAVVSPANSFGLMDGGYDAAITAYFGNDLMNDVQQKIIRRWYGEQPVGTSMTVPIKCKTVPDERTLQNKYAILIHTPTMRTPEKIVDSRIIYQCMRTTLIEAIRQEVDHIVIPAFGGATGMVPYDEIAKMMCFAYRQIYNKPKELNWVYARSIAYHLM